MTRLTSERLAELHFHYTAMAGRTNSKEFGDLASVLAEVTALRPAAKAMREALAAITSAYDSNNLQMNSPEVGGGRNESSYPWHEEWLHMAARALRAATEAGVE